MRIVGLVDYGMGNLGSVVNAFERLGVACDLCRTPEDLDTVSGIVLPGVGAFHAAMENLRSRGLDRALTRRVVDEGAPFLGICLGLQLIAQDSTELGFSQGLGWIEGHVVRMEPADGHPIPHVGWNEVRHVPPAPLFERVADDAHFFFDHSYSLQCPSDLVAATCEYGGSWVAAVARDNIQAVQFHPEKSQRKGLRLLRNFLRFVDRRTGGVGVAC